jgi:glycosyltransferase involved in cell wall biosynthesis
MKKLLIVSSDDIILYQPTILNLYDYLENDFSIIIISFEPEFLGKVKNVTRNIIYIHIPGMAKFFYKKIDLISNALLKRVDKHLFRISFRLSLLRRYKCKLLVSELKKHQADKVIAVDIMPLFAVQHLFRRSDFLSLEIIPGDPYVKKINLLKIGAVIIQNKERYEYIFGRATLKTFYIQNAPFCSQGFQYNGPRQDLVWGGSIVKNFGVLHCIEFITKYPEFNLTLKGASEKKTLRIIQSEFKSLLLSGKLVINENYLSVNELVEYLSKFKIGFCFYDWKLINNNINYQTAPSGKLFMYLAAGLPVIACNIPGFKFIKEKNAGILIDDYNPSSILKAIKLIEENYSVFSENSINLFREMCFDQGAKHYRNYLLSDS